MLLTSMNNYLPSIALILHSSMVLRNLKILSRTPIFRNIIACLIISTETIATGIEVAWALKYAPKFSVIPTKRLQMVYPIVLIFSNILKVRYEITTAERNRTTWSTFLYRALFIPMTRFLTISFYSSMLLEKQRYNYISGKQLYLAKLTITCLLIRIANLWQERLLQAASYIHQKCKKYLSYETQELLLFKNAIFKGIKKAADIKMESIISLDEVKESDDPVVDITNPKSPIIHVYGRSEIEQWLKIKPESPTTRAPLSPDMLVPLSKVKQWLREAEASQFPDPFKPSLNILLNILLIYFDDKNRRINALFWQMCHFLRGAN